MEGTNAGAASLTCIPSCATVCPRTANEDGGAGGQLCRHGKAGILSVAKAVGARYADKAVCDSAELS